MLKFDFPIYNSFARMSAYLVYHAQIALIILLIISLLVLIYGIYVYFEKSDPKTKTRKMSFVYADGVITIFTSMILAVGIGKIPLHNFWQNRALEVLNSNVIVKKNPNQRDHIIYNIKENGKKIAVLKQTDYDQLSLIGTNNEGKSMAYLIRYLHTRHIKTSAMSVEKERVSARTKSREYMVYTHSPKMVLER